MSAPKHTLAHLIRAGEIKYMCTPWRTLVSSIQSITAGKPMQQPSPTQESITAHNLGLAAGAPYKQVPSDGKLTRLDIQRKIGNDASYDTITEMLDKQGNPEFDQWLSTGIYLNKVDRNELHALNLDQYHDECMRIVQGHEDILKQLGKLEVGQTALVRFRVGQELSAVESEYRFRTFTRLNYDWSQDQAVKSRINYRDKRETKLITNNTHLHDSCFSESTETLVENLVRMHYHDTDGDRDSNYYTAEMMIVLNTSDELEYNAWMYLQSGLYYAELLKFHKCQAYADLVNQGKINDIQINVVSEKDGENNNNYTYHDFWD